MEITMEERKALAGRIAKLNYLYTADYLGDLETAEEEKKKIAEMQKKDEFCCMILTGEQNAKITLDCMKSCVDVIRFLNDEKNGVDAWQMAGIKAMLDQSNSDGGFSYDLPQAISDVLGIRFLDK